MPSRRCRRCRRPDRTCHRPSTRCSGIQWPRRTVRRCRCRRCWCHVARLLRLRCGSQSPGRRCRGANRRRAPLRPPAPSADTRWWLGRSMCLAHSRHRPSTHHRVRRCRALRSAPSSTPRATFPLSPDVDAPPVPVEGRSDELTQLRADIWGGCGFPVGRDRRVAHREHLQGVAKNHARSTRSRNNAPG